MEERAGPPTVSKLKERNSSDLRGLPDGGGEAFWHPRIQPLGAPPVSDTPRATSTSPMIHRPVR